MSPKHLCWKSPSTLPTSHSHTSQVSNYTLLAPLTPLHTITIHKRRRQSQKECVYSSTANKPIQEKISPPHKTHLPLLQPPIPITPSRRRPTRHLGLIRLTILLRKASAHFLVRLEMRFLALFTAVPLAVAFQTLLERRGGCGFAAVRAAW